MSESELSRGTNQSGVRLYNERLILSLIRKHGALPKAEIARRTGLSAQTISVIMRGLNGDELVRREKRVRGNIGQPSVPFSLNKEGAFSIGLKVGRRSAELVAIDFVGTVINSLRKTYAYPTPELVLNFVSGGLSTLVDGFSKKQMARISGIGIAIPFELWNWADEIGAPDGAMDGWLDCDIRAEVGKICDWRVYVCNDATAACAAELVFGVGAGHSDFLYYFVGSFVGGGLVLDGNLVTGRNGNAGALGPLPVPAKDGRTSRQLVQCASIYLLENQLATEGADPSAIWQSPDSWFNFGKPLDDWIDEAADGLAYGSVAALSIVDIEAVIIDGAFPSGVRTRLVERVRKKFEASDRRGLSDITIIEGSIGAPARSIGGACLPLLVNFARDREVMFKYRNAESETAADFAGANPRLNPNNRTSIYP